MVLFYGISTIVGYLMLNPVFTYISNCNIIAEGFRFMPLDLVRLRTFRLSTWVN